MPNGDKYWFLNGELHREDGPSIITKEGMEQWHFNGERHREDGPAIVYKNGIEEYCLYDKRLNKQKIYILIDLGYPIKTAIKLSKL